MADYRLNLDTLNAIAVKLGASGDHARETAALNAICASLGGAGGHVRTLAALNEWALRLGDAGGHRRSVVAANAISLRLGGGGDHRRTLAALDEIAGRIALPDPVTSGSVRAQMMVGQSGTYAGGERATHRLRDRTNVAIARPWLEYFHGRILSSGVVDTELETGLASGVAAKYRAAILTGISGTGKNQTGATVHRATFLGMLDDPAFVDRCLERDPADRGARPCWTWASGRARSRCRSRTSTGRPASRRSTSRTAALELARENASASAWTAASNCFCTTRSVGFPPGPYDLVVSNPPYVREGRAHRARRQRCATGSRGPRSSTRDRPARSPRRRAACSGAGARSSSRPTGTPRAR